MAALVVWGRADGSLAFAAACVIALVAIASIQRAGEGRPASSPAAGPPALYEAAAPPPYSEAVEILPDPFMMVQGGDIDDIAGRRITYANAAARSLLGVPRDGALLVGALRNPEVLEAVDVSLFGGKAQTAAYDAGGSQDRVWRAWTAPLTSDDPARPQAVLTLQDETDVRRMERMRVDFLANASHELRTPLASLSGFIETLRGHARDDTAARERFLGIMAGQAERMARLIDDLLSLSRIELNEHVPPSGACDLTAAVADTLDALAPVIAARRVGLDLRLPPAGVAMIAGDRDQIVQVAQNLIDNALKYAAPDGVVAIEVVADLSREAVQAGSGTAMREGGGRLSLLTPDWRADERFALLRVSDDGPGMAREHLPRLAERFYRVEGQKSGERSGTGLGLAIVKHIVNRHRGGLAVDSAPGRGSTFTVHLPLAVRREPPRPVDTNRPTIRARSQDPVPLS